MKYMIHSSDVMKKRGNPTNFVGISSFFKYTELSLIPECCIIKGQ